MFGPRGAVSILGAAALLFIAVLAASAVGSAAVGVTAFREGLPFAEAMELATRDPLLLSLCQLAGLVTATGVGVLASFGSDVSYKKALVIEPVPLAITMLALTAGFALQFPLHELANLIAEIDPRLAPSEAQEMAIRQALRIDSVWTAITVPLAIVAIPAASEELLFRGLLLPGLEKKHGPIVALLLSSLLFGLIHGAPVAMAYATVAGLVLGHVRLKTGSVLPCIALHGAFNAVPVLLPAEVVRIEGFNTIGGDVYHLPLAFVVGGAVVAGICVVVMTSLSEPE